MQLIKKPRAYSKQGLTPHLMPYTPPYTFTPFLNPPKISTLKSRKTQSTSQNQHNNPENKATHQPNTTIQNTIQNPKHLDNT